jgi:hypothetical protein
MNKNLKQSGSETRAEVDSQGNVILHNGGDTGVVFGKDGKPSVHEINHRPDGSVVVGGEVVGGKGAGEVMKGIGDRTVLDIARPNEGLINKWPSHPVDPFPMKPFPGPTPDWPTKPWHPVPDFDSRRLNDDAIWQRYLEGRQGTKSLKPANDQ